jgi:hypothetical protein
MSETKEQIVMVDRVEEIGGIIARVEIALNSALNMIEGDGLPPDWDYLRLVRSQLPRLQELTCAQREESKA